MGKVVASLLFAFGVVLCALGLLFLVGSGGRTHRYVIAFVCLSAGAMAQIGAVAMLKKIKAKSPQKVREDLLALASKQHGSLTIAELQAKMPGRSAIAIEIIEDMCRQGTCQMRMTGGVATYVFASLQAVVMIRRCQFCGFEAALSSDLTTCPKCGGAITSTNSRDADAISLDA